MKKTLAACLVLVGVAIAFAWAFNRNAARGERQAEALRREERRGEERQRLLRERTALQARQVSAEDLPSLMAAGAEAQAIRARLAARTRKPPEAGTGPAEPFTDSEPVAAGSWADAGQATPRSALMSVLWAASHGDVDRLADLLEFSGATRVEAEAFFAQLPLAAQQEYGSPERVVATLLAGNFPKDATEATYNGGGGNAESAYASLSIDHSAGETRTNVYALELTASGWRLQVPSAVLAGYERILQGESAPAIAGSLP